MTDDWYKIIGIRFGGLILFGEEALKRLNAENDYDQLHSLAEFKFMARCDLGDKWGEYAEHAPVIITLKENTPIDVRIRRPIAHRII